MPEAATAKRAYFKPEALKRIQAMDRPQIGQPFNPYKICHGSVIPDALMVSTRLTPGAKLTYARLQKYGGADGLAFPGMETLAQECGVSVRQMHRYMSELEDNKLIEPTRRGLGLTNTYKLTFGYVYNDIWDEVFPGHNETAIPDLPTLADPNMPETADPKVSALADPLYEEENQSKRISLRESEDEDDDPRESQDLMEDKTSDAIVESGIESNPNPLPPSPAAIPSYDPTTIRRVKASDVNPSYVRRSERESMAETLTNTIRRVISVKGKPTKSELRMWLLSSPMPEGASEDELQDHVVARFREINLADVKYPRPYLRKILASTDFWDMEYRSAGATRSVPAKKTASAVLHDPKLVAMALDRFVNTESWRSS